MKKNQVKFKYENQEIELILRDKVGAAEINRLFQIYNESSKTGLIVTHKVINLLISIYSLEITKTLRFVAGTKISNVLEDLSEKLNCKQWSFSALYDKESNRYLQPHKSLKHYFLENDQYYKKLYLMPKRISLEITFNDKTEKVSVPPNLRHIELLYYVAKNFKIPNEQIFQYSLFISSYNENDQLITSYFPPYSYLKYIDGENKCLMTNQSLMHTTILNFDHTSVKKLISKGFSIDHKDSNVISFFNLFFYKYLLLYLSIHYFT